MENAKISDQGAKQLFSALQKQDYIRKLSLSKNQLGNLACIFLGVFIQKNPTLEELYLHWNCIRSQGGAELFRQLGKNDTLKVLDLSFNSMGNLDVETKQVDEDHSELLRKKKEQMKNYKKECSKEISKYLQNSSLLHLDISYNNFSVEDMVAL